MGETELTKRIKKATHRFRPLLNNTMRTIRWADEVWTPTGIVDSIRFEDYYEKEEYLCKLIDVGRYSDDDLKIASYRHELGKCFRDGSTNKDESKCHGCTLRNHLWNIGMMTTCYEVKISYSDFKSENGHNFHDNRNYYAVPKNIVKKIEPLVPDDIGILVWNETNKSAGLRTYKECVFREIDNEIRWILLYNAMKKWCDGEKFI